MAKQLKKPDSFYENFDRKPGSFPKVTHYCPGCGHGRIHKLIAEALDELGCKDDTVFVSPVGCSVFGYYYFDCGNIQAAHGRAPAVGTGAARSNPGKITISYQGDGDLAAIGTSEIIHAANRGERMTVIFVNNQIYGMTGGQMAPTTLEGDSTSTSPAGRDVASMGYPLRMSEIIAGLEAPAYVERVAVSDSKNIMKAKKAIHKALKAQKDGIGFGFVEILSACPIGWKMKPKDAVKKINDVVAKYFPVQVFKDDIANRQPKPVVSTTPDNNAIIKALGVDINERVFSPDKNFINNFKMQKIRIAGFGGQGVLMAGTTIGNLGMELGLDVSWLPSYGPEMRGGTANCHVVLSNKTIGSPVVEKADVLIAMNEPSLDEFLPTVVAGGLVIINSSIISKQCAKKDVTALYVPMNEIAESCGIKAAANMVAVTAYLAHSKVIDIEKLIQLVRKNFKKAALIEQNIAVIKKTSEWINNNRK